MSVMLTMRPALTLVTLTVDAVKPGIEELIISLPSMSGDYNFQCELLSGEAGWEA